MQFLWFRIGVGVVDNILFAIGGHDGPLVRKSCEKYNAETDSWNSIADMTYRRRNAGNLLLLNFQWF